MRQDQYHKIRKGDQDLIALEGIHPVKHAIRFGAQIKEIIISEDFNEKVLDLLQSEEAKFIKENAVVVDKNTFKNLTPYKVHSKIIATAKKPKYSAESVIQNTPVVFLENPQTPENIGMSIRIAAGFGASIVVLSRINIFNASVLHAAAGLHFATPVLQISSLDELKKFNLPVFAADPEGKNIKETPLPKHSIIAFGTEREGLTKELLSLAKEKISLPMRPGVSSLNLATSVSGMLYAADFI